MPELDTSFTAALPESDNGLAVPYLEQSFEHRSYIVKNQNIVSRGQKRGNISDPTNCIFTKVVSCYSSINSWFVLAIFACLTENTCLFVVNSFHTLLVYQHESGLFPRLLGIGQNI